MLRLMHSLVSHLPRRYRVIRERLENHYEQRWQVCFNELIDLMPLPLYAFSMSEEAKQQGSVKRVSVIRETRESGQLLLFHFFPIFA